MPHIFALRPRVTVADKRGQGAGRAEFLSCPMGCAPAWGFCGVPPRHNSPPPPPSPAHTTHHQEGVLYTMRAQCVDWGDFVNPPRCSTVTFMCFQAVQGVTIAQAALCPLAVSPMSLSWPPAGITVTYIRSNGDRATVISASEQGGP